MAVIQWTDNLATNVTQFDEQHKKLIKMINDLHDAMSSGKGKEAAGKVLVDLVNYCGTHFSAEEKLMTTHNYPEYAEHKKLHDDLTRQALELKKGYEQGKPVITIELLTFLRNWLTNHITGTDKKYSAFFKSKGVA